MQKNIFKYRVNFFTLIILSCIISFVEKYQENGIVKQIIAQLLSILVVTTVYYLVYFITKGMGVLAEKYTK